MTLQEIINEVMAINEELNAIRERLDHLMYGEDAGGQGIIPTETLDRIRGLYDKICEGQDFI